MERVKTIQHNGVAIAFLDASGIVDIDEFCSLLIALTTVAIDQNINHILLDVSNAFMAPKVRETTKQEAEKAKKHLGKVHTAISGLNGMQRFIANLLNKEEYFGKDLEDAKNWLAGKA